METYQNVIVSSSDKNGHLLSFEAGVKTHLTSIDIIRAQFSERNNYGFEGLRPELKEVFRDSVAEKKFFYQGNYSLRSAEIVDDIINKKYGGFLRSLFLESKLLDMMVLQIDQYHDDQQEESSQQILRKSDVDKVERAIKIIKDNMQQNLSVEQLAKEVGTNVNKLQTGFKRMYNLTVNKYMQQVKLDRARELLESSDYNISEVVNMIGFSNRSYFSKIFRERYGTNPKYFLRNYAETEEGENTK